jgi:hypothetical protein
MPDLISAAIESKIANSIVVGVSSRLKAVLLGYGGTPRAGSSNNYADTLSDVTENLPDLIQALDVRIVELRRLLGDM